MEIKVHTKDYRIVSFLNVVQSSIHSGDKYFCFITRDDLIESAHMLNLEQVERIEFCK